MARRDKRGAIGKREEIEKREDVCDVEEHACRGELARRCQSYQI